MKIEDLKYEKQMISVDVILFGILDDTLHVLLVKRKSDPFKNKFSLPGGGVYNDETVENALKRELKEKLDIKGIIPVLAGVFSDPKRDERFRNISVSFYAMVNAQDLQFTQNTPKVLEAKWVPIHQVPDLAFDHTKILKTSLSLLRERLYDIDFMKPSLPKTFTLGQLQRIYESILAEPLDKRNFRRKLNSLKCLKNTGQKNQDDPRKKSFVFCFK